MPRTCLLCGDDEAGPDALTANLCVCEGCRRRVTVGSDAYCSRCGTYAPAAVNDPAGCGGCRHQTLWRSCTTLGEYRKPLKEYVLRAKSPQGESVARALGTLAARRLTTALPRELDAVVFVPMHWSRKLLRHANAARIMAEAVSEAIRVPSLGAVRVVRAVKKQGTLSRRERIRTVRGAYDVQSERVAGKRLLLVDDVMTTGSTMRELAKRLNEAGARSLDVLVVARAGPQAADA